jgi:hypothetical protein
MLTGHHDFRAILKHHGVGHWLIKDNLIIRSKRNCLIKLELFSAYLDNLGI